MKKLYISNAFSLSMLNREGTWRGLQPVELSEVPDLIALLEEQLEVVSCIGHASTAAILSSLLGRDLPVQRVSVKLEETDVLLVGQYVGPRLPRGATELPSDATIEWWWAL